MMEAGAREVPEDVMADAIAFAVKHAAEVSDLIAQLVRMCGKPKQEVASETGEPALLEFCAAKYASRIDDALACTASRARATGITAIRERGHGPGGRTRSSP